MLVSCICWHREQTGSSGFHPVGPGFSGLGCLGLGCTELAPALFSCRSAWSHRHGRMQPSLGQPGDRTPGWTRDALRAGTVLIHQGIRCAAKNIGG